MLVPGVAVRLDAGHQLALLPCRSQARRLLRPPAPAYRTRREHPQRPSRSGWSPVRPRPTSGYGCRLSSVSRHLRCGWARH